MDTSEAQLEGEGGTGRGGGEGSEGGGGEEGMKTVKSVEEQLCVGV